MEGVSDSPQLEQKKALPVKMMSVDIQVQLKRSWCHCQDRNVMITWKQEVITVAVSSSLHYNDVIMGTIASQITSFMIVYSKVYSGADQRKHESSASLAFVQGIHRGPVNSPHKWPVTRKMFPFDDVIIGHVGACTISRRSSEWLYHHYRC